MDAMNVYPGNKFLKRFLPQGNEFLSLTDEIYNTMTNNDISEVTMNVLSKITKNLPKISKQMKSEEISMKHIKEGNTANKNSDFQTSLAHYNMALLYAPKNSKEMLLAYYFRCIVLQAADAWAACNEAIDRFLAMKDDLHCPRAFVLNLMKRKEAINSYVQESIFQNQILNYCDKYFHNEKYNPQIPCTSPEIRVDISSEFKIVAAEDIKVGSILSSEKAYVSYTLPANALTSCHFCQRMSLNLIPCDGCCYALFCSEKCQKECFDEFHQYECNIIDAINEIDVGKNFNLALRACFKMKKQCKSWDEFINASYNTGLRRFETSTVDEIYDVNSKFSLLCCKDDKPFIHGILFNGIFICAAILHYVEKHIPSFLPQNLDEKNKAIRAFGRILMFLAVYHPPQVLIQPRIELKNAEMAVNELSNYGLFSFTGKLKFSCTPNAIVANKNNELVIIALSPIKRGKELTIPLIAHRHDVSNIGREITLHADAFKSLGIMCDCKNNDDHPPSQLSKYQKTYITKLNLHTIKEKFNVINLPDIYETLLKALEILHDVPNSNEYKELFVQFRRCIFCFETKACDNYIIDDIPSKEIKQYLL